MIKAFTYQAPISPQRTLMARKTGSLIEVKSDTEPPVFLQDDAYELLAKGIGGYNQGTATFNNTNSWIDTLITTVKGSGSVATAIEYALDILHNEDKGIALPYRQYIWKGGTYAADLKDEQGNPDPRAGQDWCFGYGEEEWLVGQAFETVQIDAVGDLTAVPPIQPVGRINCQTGI